MTDICGVTARNIMRKNPRLLKIEIDRNPIDYDIFLEVDFLIKTKLVQKIKNKGLINKFKYNQPLCCN